MRYNDKVVNYFSVRKHVGELSADDKNIGSAQVGTQSSGNVVRMGLQVVGNTVKDIKFKAYGSGYMIAACAFTTEWALSKTLTEIEHFSSDIIVNALSLPAFRVHCALLAEDALKAAVVNYNEHAKEHMNKQTITGDLL